MTGEEVRKLRDDELKAELARLRNKLFDLRTQTVTDKVADSSQFSKAKRDIARLLTERTARHAAKNPKAVAKAPAAKVTPPRAKATGAAKAPAAKKAAAKKSVARKAKA
jgi:ribosomal protein L29